MHNPKVTMIPPTLDRQTKIAFSEQRRKRVAGYARVSTDLEEQLNSYAAQVDYYTTKIRENPAWDFVEVYTDEGISATSTAKRDGFNRMIRDALNGEIDLILTKSVSRFARNTVDSLIFIRRLKERGIAVFFEKENIDSLDAKGELMLTIMSSLAQEESRSISENVTWGLRKNMRDGKVNMPFKSFLGYQKGADGKPEIVESESEIVRQIYKLYLQGHSALAIANHLTATAVPTPRRLQTWHPHTVLSILRNEKYCGCNLTQKTYCESFLTHKMLKNRGELEQYFAEDSHPAIVSRETFDLVQSEIKTVGEVGRNRSTTSAFGNRVVCGECGGFYGKKVWGSYKNDDKYCREVWRCNGKYKRGAAGAQCDSRHLTAEQLEQVFVTAFNKIIAVRDDYFAEYDTVVAALTDTAALDREIDALNAEVNSTYALLKLALDRGSHGDADIGEFEAEFAATNARYEDQRRRVAELTDRRQQILARRGKLNMFLDELRSRDGLLDGFDERLFRATVEMMTVGGDRVTVRFRDCSEVSVEVRK
jgi:DNA invertase Pin-like site-specific DNA recombinase